MFLNIKIIVIEPDKIVSQIRLRQNRRRKVRESIGMNVLSTQEDEGQSTTELNGQFIHYQQLMDVILRIKSLRTDRDEFQSLHATEYEGRMEELLALEAYLKSPSSNTALRLYTANIYFYRILNKALRTQRSDVIFPLRWFIRDINMGIKRDQCKSRIQVYRGQWMANGEIDILQRSVGKLICTTGFLSTTKDPDVAHLFLSDYAATDDRQRVLLVIDADPNELNAKPFADISAYSKFPEEKEVLFTLGSIFRLNDIDCTSDGVWNIRMKLCGDKETDMQQLLRNIRKTKSPDFRTLGDVLKNMGQFELAEKFLHRSLEAWPTNHQNHPSLGHLYLTLSDVARGKDDMEGEIIWCEKALNIFEQSVLSDNVATAKLCNLKGEIHRRKGNYNEALKWYDEGLQFFRKANIYNHPDIGKIYANISETYRAQERYREALVMVEQVLAFRQKTLHPNHRDFASTYDRIGLIYQYFGEYNLAQISFDASLKIKFSALPFLHPKVATGYQYIGLLYEKRNETQQALAYLKKALSIYQQKLPVGHRDIISTEEDIQRLQTDIHEQSNLND